MLHGKLLNYVIAALFEIARAWKQPQCPATKELVGFLEHCRFLFIILLI